ncbi:MAG: hypothetical protein WAU70_15845 [Flavobacteriales bacterium]
MQRTSSLLPAFALGLLTVFSACSSSNDVVQNGLLQHRKYNNPGWFVDLPSGSTKHAPVNAMGSTEPVTPVFRERSDLPTATLARGPVTPEVQREENNGSALNVEPPMEDATSASLPSNGLSLSFTRGHKDRIVRISTVEEISKGMSRAEPPQDAGGVDIFALLGFIFAFLFPVAGLVLSIIGLNRTRGGGRGHGLAVAGLVISIVFLAVYGVAVLH